MPYELLACSKSIIDSEDTLDGECGITIVVIECMPHYDKLIEWVTQCYLVNGFMPCPDCNVIPMIHQLTKKFLN